MNEPHVFPIENIENEEFLSAIQNIMLSGLPVFPQLERQVLAANREQRTLDIFATQGVNFVAFMRVCFVSASLKFLYGLFCPCDPAK